MRVLGEADKSRNAAKKGGLPIERDACQFSFRNAPRCYNQSVALQVPKQMITPVQGTALETRDDHAYSQETRRLILQVLSSNVSHSVIESD